MSRRFKFLAFVLFFLTSQLFYINKEVLLPRRESEQVNVLLLSYQRSGSSFTGELLSSCEDCSYFFEPLFIEEHIHKTPTVSAYQKNLEGVFSCDNETLNELRVGTKFWIVRKFGQFYNTFNDSGSVVNALCRKDKLKVVKTIRIRINETAPLIEKFPNLKIVHLVRDPRGAINSVLKRPNDWSSKYKSSTQYCIDMTNDVKAGRKLSKDRYYLVRYEDLVLHAHEEVEKIFKFLDHPITKNVKAFLHKHTRAEIDPIGKEESQMYYSTFRYSSFDPFAWKKEMSEKEIREVEVSCKDVLIGLNYTPIYEIL